MQQQELSSMVLKVLKPQINAITDDKSLNHKVVLTAALFMAMNPASTVAKTPNQQASMLCHGEQCSALQYRIDQFCHHVTMMLAVQSTVVPI